ncbi:chymotrypsin-2-like [Anthonomus grandis grandis]|uniref:chymotrypsin-2-like n=1 Tax=Anthonomus grandis grandis TaxID=2921223 RepID=UPI002165A8A6|nr:chymotrypsin-2-like [Anthonomus grandis grandis]
MRSLKLFGVLVLLVQLSQQAAIDNRIVNGKKVSIEDYPYQVSLFRKNLDGSIRFFCGGSIISKKCILTAGHCAVKPDENSEKTWTYITPEEVSVLPGKASTLDSSSAISAEKINVHPNFQATFIFKNHKLIGGTLAENDIAVIFLKKLLEYSTSIAKISLPPQGESESIFYGKVAVATGFGLTYNSISTTDLYAVNLTISKTNTLCHNNEMICLAEQENQRGTCSGDSGGPLVINKVQYGISSAIFNPTDPLVCQKSSEFIFVNIIHYREWISKNSDVDEADDVIGEDLRGNGIEE